MDTWVASASGMVTNTAMMMSVQISAWFPSNSFGYNLEFQQKFF